MGRDFILQIAAIALGGGTVQFLIHLMKRRGELKALDRTSESSLLTGASDLVAKLQSDRDSDRKELERMRETVEKNRAAFEQELRELKNAKQAEIDRLVSALELANEENERLHAIVAQLRTDIILYKRQIDDLLVRLDRRKRKAA